MIPETKVAVPTWMAEASIMPVLLVWGRLVLAH